MIGVYEKMKTDWQAYCLMSGLALVEEMNKPTTYINTKFYKNKKTNYTNFRTLRFKVKELSVVKKWWEITVNWEKKLNIDLLGPSFKNGPKQENYSKQYYLIFSPLWLFHILKITGKLPSKTTFKTCIKRLRSMTIKRSGSRYFIEKNEIEKIVNKPTLFNKLFYDKSLAAGAFIISFDLEFRGISTGELSLCMTTKYEDFLKFLLKVANKWGWATLDYLSDVNIEYSLKRGIKATPQKEFRLKSKAIKEIYNLAGPLIDREKEEFIQFHIKRISRKRLYRKQNETQKIILNVLKKGPNKSTEIQKYAGIRVDVVLDHLNNLERKGLVSKKRNGKRYMWSLK